MFIDSMFIPEITRVKAGSYSKDLYDACYKKVHTSMMYFFDLYYAGCGYDNFRSVFGRLAMEVTKKSKNKLSWYYFDEKWDETFYPEGHVAVCSVWKQDNHIGKHADELINLLYSLCAE